MPCKREWENLVSAMYEIDWDRIQFDLYNWGMRQSDSAAVRVEERKVHVHK